jgi:hypothetical protein
MVHVVHFLPLGSHMSVRAKSLLHIHRRRIFSMIIQGGSSPETRTAQVIFPAAAKHVKPFDHASLDQRWETTPDTYVLLRNMIL